MPIAIRSRSLFAGLALLLGNSAAQSQGVAAPAFIVRGIDGRSAQIEPAALKKPLLVSLFSVKDPDWRETLLAVRSLERRFGAQGFAGLAVAYDMPGAKDALAEFALAEKLRFPIGLDRGGAFAALGGDAVPRTVLIAPDGAIALKSPEPVSRTEPEVGALIPGLLKQRKAILKEDKRRAKAARRAERALERAAKRVQAVEPAALKARLDAGEKLNIAFIGPKEAFEHKHIPGAVHVDYDDVERFFASKDPAQEWILYCGCAASPLGLSGRAAARLRLKGFKRTAYLAGHIQEWERKQYPLRAD